VRRQVARIVAIVTLVIVQTAGPALAAGSTWFIQPTPEAAVHVYDHLGGVSCPVPTTCIAVGSSGPERHGAMLSQSALAEIRVGGHWEVQAAPSPGRFTVLSSVSCLSVTDCTAFGSTSTGNGGTATGGPLAEHWDGTTWTIEPTVDPPSAAAEFDGGTCITPDNCTAVGAYLPPNASKYLTLAEHWDGTSWAIQPTPNVVGSETTEAVLEAVSCPSAIACTAVGQAGYRGKGYAMLVERWNGTRWFRQLVTVPSGDQSLDSVSCPTAFRCFAVGNGSVGAAAEYWNGTSWTAQAVPAALSYLAGVTCRSIANCTAVGSPGAAQWDGTSWTFQATPNPTGHTNWTLDAVSCTSATACTAVGDVKLVHRINPLAEHR
jgi:hypothetical protein